MHFAPDAVRLRMMNATYWFVSAQSAPGTRSAADHICACVVGVGCTRVGLTG